MAAPLCPPAPDGSRYEWHEISREQYLEASKGKWASAYELRELFDRPAPVAAAPEGFVMVPVDSVVPCGCGCHRHCCRHCGYELGGHASRLPGVKDA